MARAARAAQREHERHERRKGSALHGAVDTLGHLLALHVTPAAASDRNDVEHLAAAACAADHGIQLEVIKLSEVRRGFVRLPKITNACQTWWPACTSVSA